MGIRPLGTKEYAGKGYQGQGVSKKGGVYTYQRAVWDASQMGGWHAAVLLLFGIHVWRRSPLAFHGESEQHAALTDFMSSIANEFGIGVTSGDMRYVSSQDSEALHGRRFRRGQSAFVGGTCRRGGSEALDNMSSG